MPNVNSTIEDHLIERDIMVERYKRNLIGRVFRLLTELEEKVVAQIAKLDPSQVQPRYKDARLARLLAEIQVQVDQYGKALTAEVMPDMDTLAKDESQFGVRLFNSVPPVALDIIAPTAVMLKAAVATRPFQGKLLKEWVADAAPATRMRLRAVIRQGVAEGQTIDQMVRAIKGTAANQYADGIMEITRRGATAMVRTAVNHVVSAARDETYAANADLIKGVKWVSVLDSRTTSICQSRDGKVFPLGSGPRPPAHVNCRSSTVPVMKSWKELGIPLGESPEGTRASMDGQVSAAQTYQTWLKGRSAAFQDEVLGKTKGELFRKGGLSVDSFVDKSGHTYTLDELRAREPAAFSKAGLDAS